MKKLSLILALITVATMCLSACTDQKGGDTTTTTTTAATTTTTTTTTQKDNDDPSTPGNPGNPGNPDDPQPPAGPTYKTPEAITLDGDLADWAETKPISMEGTGEFEGKKATFYAVLLEDGLYLACDAYHNTYTTNQNDWWKNSNFEIFVGTRANTQYWLSAKGMGAEGSVCQKSGNMSDGIMVTEALTDAATAYHTVSEAFIAKDKLPADAIYADITRVGVAWKTDGDRSNNNGNDAASDWWTPVGTMTNNNAEAHQCYVQGDGIYIPNEYFDLKGDRLVSMRSEWSYMTATGDANAAGEGWNTAASADWNKGNAPFGNRVPGSANLWGTGDSPADGTQNKAYFWAVKEFEVADLDSLKDVALLISMFYDDTCTLYINGEAVFSHTSGNAWNDGAYIYKLADDASSLLVEGKNVIAVSLHQHHGGYEFDLALFASDDGAFIVKSNP